MSGLFRVRSTWVGRSSGLTAWVAETVEAGQVSQVRSTPVSVPVSFPVSGGEEEQASKSAKEAVEAPGLISDTHNRVGSAPARILTKAVAILSTNHEGIRAKRTKPTNVR